MVAQCLGKPWRELKPSGPDATQWLPWTAGKGSTTHSRERSFGAYCRLCVSVSEADRDPKTHFYAIFLVFTADWLT